MRGPGQCFAIPADLQKPDHLKRLVADISQREDRRFGIKRLFHTSR